MEKETVFLSVQKAVCRITRLAHPNPDATMVVDTANIHLRVVLRQSSACEWPPLSFYSKKLDPSQLKCVGFDRELLAIWYFCFLLEGRSFQVLTDHKTRHTDLVSSGKLGSSLSFHT